MLIPFLIKDFNERRRRNRAYSLRAYASSLGVNSGVLSAIMNRKRPLTVKTGRRIIAAVDADLATKYRLMESLVDELPSLSESSRFQELSADTVELLGNWEYFAILSLLETKGFRYSPEAVADRLQLNRASVVEAMKLLLRVGLLKEHANGYMPTHKNVTTTHDVPSAALRRVHRQTIEKALGAIEGQTVEERDFSGMTMAIARKKLPQAKQLIRKFRREMSALLEDGDRTDVYRLNIQLFSLESKKKERS